MKSAWYARGVRCAIILLLLSAGVFAVNAQVRHTSLGAVVVPALANPGFEGEFTTRGAPEIVIAEGWTEWSNSGGQLHRPEYKPELADLGCGRVHTGYKAQKTFTTYAAHDGGVWQMVDGLVEDEWYEFSCWAWNWSSQQDNPDISTNPGKGSTLVGANPWGLAWPNHYTTIWGKAALEQYDKWTKVKVIFQAWSPKAALLTRGLAEWPVRHNDYEWDSCELVVAQFDPCPTPTPAPAPTAHPQVCPSLEEIATLIANRDPVIWPK